MLRITQKNETKVHRQRLSTAPNLTDIHHSLSQVLEKKGEVSELAWSVNGNSYKLVIHCRIFEGEPRWRLFEEHVGYESVLWEYVSCDVLLIFNLIASSTGQQELVVPAERTLGTRDALRDPVKTLSSYFLMPETFEDGKNTSFSSLDIDHKEPAVLQTASRAAKTVDKQAIHSVMMCLRRFDTGMFTYAAFLYFLEQEYFRAYRTRGYLSVVLFSVSKKKGLQLPGGKLPPDGLREIALRIGSLKRQNDVLAHFDVEDTFILMLPGTEVSGARKMVSRIFNALNARPICGGISPEVMQIEFGVAGIPEDCTDLGALLGEAEYDKRRSSATSFPIEEYKVS